MRKVLFVLACMCLPLTGSAQDWRKDISTFDFLQVAYSVPDADFQKDFTDWYKSGQVRLELSNQIQILACEERPLPKDPEKRAATLLINPDFLSYTSLSSSDLLFDPQALQMERWSEIYHEYGHLLAHFSGEMPLNPPAWVETKEQLARYQWNHELRAFWGQWQFLRDHNYGWVMIKQSRIRKVGLWPAFMEVAYKNLRVYPTYLEYKEYWDRFYKEELE